MILIRTKKLLLAILLLLVLGSIAVWWVAQNTDKSMRTELLQQAKIVASSIPVEMLASLTASEKDLNTEPYKHIKSQLASMRSARPQCRFLYLMGRGGGGEVFFFVDSLPTDSEDYAPPGLIYEEVSDSYIAAFDSMHESVVGPVTDRWGTLVTALVPVKTPGTGDLLAMLGMDVEAASWNEEIIRRCLGPSIITVLLVILILLSGSREKTLLTLNKSNEELELRSEFERLISKLSSEFTGLVLKDLDAGIERALASIGAFAGVDRAYVFLFHKDDDLADNTHEWCAEGIKPQIDNLKGISIKEELPWFESFIRKRVILEIPDVSSLPPEAEAERGHFKFQAIQSVIVVPMVLEDHLIGFLGFDAVSRKKKWNDDDQAILRLVGEVFSNAIGRRQWELEREELIAELRSALDQIKTLSGLLPICAQCKKIRDDKGYWNQIEAYVHKHSGAKFSHSICPDCAKELYPDLDIH